MQRFPLSSSYAAATTSVWSSFPSLPIIRGPRSYKADTHAQCSDGNACRIASYSHSTLTPGIFTIYCPLGIAVKLHIELYLFQDTQFFVHWKRHVGDIASMHTTFNHSIPPAPVLDDFEYLDYKSISQLQMVR